MNDSCDFQFGLYDAVSAGAQIGTTLTKTAVTVTGGLMAVQLDFGGGVFEGNSRFLEVAVRCPAGGGSYTSLSPRQEVTPAPYAMFATVAPWSGITGTPSGFADGTDDKLTEAEVETFVTNGPIDLAAGSSLGGEAIIIAQTSTLALSGLVEAYASSTGAFGEVRTLSFDMVPSTSQAVDLSPGALIVTYSDLAQVVNLTQNGSATPTGTDGGWNATWLTGSGPVLDAGEHVELVINLTQALVVELPTSREFTVEVKPSIGPALTLRRRTPPDLASVQNLPISVGQAPLILTGSVLAHASSSATVRSVVFQVINTSTQLQPVDLSGGSTILRYVDENQTQNIAQSFSVSATGAIGGWISNWLIGSGPLLDPGETVEIQVNLTQLLTTELTTSTAFSVEVKPSLGSALIVSRTTPAVITTVTDLD